MVLIFKAELDVEQLEQDVQEIKRVKDQQDALEDTVTPVKQKIKEQFGNDKILASEDINKWLNLVMQLELPNLKYLDILISSKY